MLVCYCDGACRPNPGQGAWGYAILDKPTHPFVGTGLWSVTTTSNQMELQAAIETLTQARNLLGPEKALKTTIDIRSDSAYVVNGMSSWIKRWMRDDWDNNTRHPVLNQTWWRQLADIVNCFHRVNWRHVRGHANDTYNNLVDRLVRERLVAHVSACGPHPEPGLLF